MSLSSLRNSQTAPTIAGAVSLAWLATDGAGGTLQLSCEPLGLNWADGARVRWRLAGLDVHWQGDPAAIAPTLPDLVNPPRSTIARSEDPTPQQRRWSIESVSSSDAWVQTGWSLASWRNHPPALTVAVAAPMRHWHFIDAIGLWPSTASAVVHATVERWLAKRLATIAGDRGGMAQGTLGGASGPCTIADSPFAAGLDHWLADGRDAIANLVADQATDLPSLASMVDLDCRTDFAGGHLVGAALEGMDWTGAHLEQANLRGATLCDADLSQGHLRGARLAGADLSGAYLAEADLTTTDLRRASLALANLSGADLMGANLTGANLSQTNFHGAIVAGADFTEAQGLADKTRQLLRDRGAIIDE